MKKLLLVLLALPLIGFGQILYLEEDDISVGGEFYNLDILNNQYNFISTFPSSNGGYGSESSFDPINNIFYITNGFGGMGGDDSTIIIGVDITNGIFVSQSIVPHSIETFEVWDNMCYYFDEEDSAAFYNLDILNNQYNFISTFPSSNGGYGSESSFDPINNIFYITNGFGGMGGDDSTIFIGVDVTNGSFVSQSVVPHSINNFEFQFSLPTSINYTNNNKEPEFLMLFNILGQRTTEKKNTPLFYIYNDGTVEKKVVIE